MTIDGVSPGRIVRPETVEELAALIAAEKGSIVPLGAGTQTAFGNPLRGADCVVDMTGLSRITTYNPAELTIHAQAGVRIGDLHRALAENGQALPLDPWNGPDATLGGIASANAQGPLRAVGSIRDWIIGMTVVHADGRISKTGGRVVKNVTGYDLAKLYTGSLGSLAVIAEISFKLRPRFERTASAVARFERLQDAAAVLAALRTGPLQPIACEFTGPGPTIWLRFGEHPRAVDWQLSQLPPAAWTIREGTAESSVWAELAERRQSMGPVVVRAIGLPSQVCEMIETIRPGSWIAHAANGIVLMALADAEAVREVRKRFPAIVEAAPAESRRRVGTFGVEGRARRMMLDMKKTFDPEGRLNPGRHIDGE